MKGNTGMGTADRVAYKVYDMLAEMTNEQVRLMLEARLYQEEIVKSQMRSKRLEMRLRNSRGETRILKSMQQAVVRDLAIASGKKGLPVPKKEKMPSHHSAE
jgi:hypothetical protein